MLPITKEPMRGVDAAAAAATAAALFLQRPALALLTSFLASGSNGKLFAAPRKSALSASCFDGINNLGRARVVSDGERDEMKERQSLKYFWSGEWSDLVRLLTVGKK